MGEREGRVASPANQCSSNTDSTTTFSLTHSLSLSTMDLNMWSLLSKDVKLKIFGLIGCSLTERLRDVLGLERVCKEWLRLNREGGLWELRCRRAAAGAGLQDDPLFR